MAYCICRISKLKSAGAISSSIDHVERKRDTPNANPSMVNEKFISTSSEKLVEQVYNRIGDQKIRTNGVLCVEILLTASPEYFRPGDMTKAGQWDGQQLDSWKEANKNWLADKFGDKLVRAELHLDESTPHIHAYLVPLDENGKLNCKSIFGGRQKLSQFQDSYGKAMEPLGLDRGVKGSRARHTEVKEYYAAVNQTPNAALTPSETQSQLADRQRVLKENEQLRRTLQSAEYQRQLLVTQLEEAKSGLTQKERDNEEWQKKFKVMTGQLRQLPLKQVAYELGMEEELSNPQQWRDGRKVIEIIEGNRFRDIETGQSTRGAIDLVMQINRSDFSEAVSWLRDRFGEAVALQTVMEGTQETILTEPKQEFMPPTVQPDNWPQVQKYLLEERRIPVVLVDKLHQQGLVYADERQNAVFLRRDLAGTTTGAFLRGTTEKDGSFKGLAYNSKRSQGWFYDLAGGKSADPVQEVVLVASAIDAMSYQTIHPPHVKTMYLSTDWSSYLPDGQLQEIPSVKVALSNSPAGDELSRRIQKDLPQAERQKPQQEDWNQDLRVLVAEMERKAQEQLLMTVKPKRDDSREYGFGR
jgi:Plasmid recombination enzyme/Protein of unknown function (DUF3991)/Toprim-like